MRIAFLNQFYTPDLAPTAHLSASLAEHLAESGHEVRVVASRGGYVAESSHSKESATDNPRVHRVWTPRLGKKNIVFRLIDYASFYMAACLRMVLMPRQDVIITLTTPPLIGMTALAHKCLHPSTKIILWNMDCYPDVVETAGIIRHNGIISRLWQATTRFLFRFFSQVVTLDGAMTDLLEGRYVRKGRSLPFTVIPNWERLSLFPEPSLEPVVVSEENPFIVLYLGNAGFGHQFDTVLDVADGLRDEPIQFVFIGGGHRQKDIAAAAKERNLTNVDVRGYIPKEETPQVMASAGAALITLSDDSKGIMSPSKLHSNLAMGLPVIYVGPTGTNVDDALVQFDCGISARHGEVAELTDYLKRLQSDTNFQSQSRRNARDAFESSYCDHVAHARFDAVLAPAELDKG